MKSLCILAVVVVAVSIPVMRANSAAELSIVRAVHPPPAAISWLVTLVFWLGSAGVSVLLVVVGLLVPRLTAVRRAAVAAVLTWAVCILLGALLGPAAGRPPVSELAGLNAGYPVTQIAVAALITYYGFLSIFPLLLLGVAVLSRVLADHPDLRRRLIAEIVPPALQPTIEHSLATLPTSTIPFITGLIALLFSGTGVVFSAYQTLNHAASVRHRLRAGFFSRYVRVFAMLATLMLGALAVGALTVVATALPGQPGVQRAAAVLGSALIVFAVLLLGAKVLLARPAPVRALWPGAVVVAVAVTVVLNVGAPLLARLVAKAGPVYGSFATVAGMFALLYLVGQALVYAAEVAAVRYARLWPRALDLNRPTAADARALALLAREQERIPAARVGFHLAAQASAPVPGGSPPGSDGQGNAATPAGQRHCRSGGRAPGTAELPNHDR